MTNITAYCWGGPNHGKFVAINSGYYKVPTSRESPATLPRRSIREKWGWFKRIVALATGIWKDVKDWEFRNSYTPAEEFTYCASRWGIGGRVFWTLSERGGFPTQKEVEMLMYGYPEHVTRENHYPIYQEDERR